MQPKVSKKSASVSASANPPTTAVKSKEAGALSVAPPPRAKPPGKTLQKPQPPLQLRGCSAAAGAQQAVIQALLFAAPDTNGRDNPDACLSGATLGAKGQALVVDAGPCVVTRVATASASRRSQLSAGSSTVEVAVGRRTLSFLAALDAHALGATKANCNVWFMRALPAELVDEYHRSSIAADAQHGMVARFVLQDALSEEQAAALQPGTRLDHLVLQLKGVLFRRQSMTALWQLVEARAERPLAFSPLLEEERGDESSPGGTSDGEEDQDVGPSIEECLELRQDLMARLVTAEGEAQERASVLQDLIRVLDGSDAEDLATWAAVNERAQHLLPPPEQHPDAAAGNEASAEAEAEAECHDSFFCARASDAGSDAEDSLPIAPVPPRRQARATAKV